MLGFVIAAELFTRFPSLDEGQLSQMRASLVREETLASVSASLGLGTEIKLGEQERDANGRVRPSILADSLEALLGAVFIDGGFTAARKVIGRVLGDSINRTDPNQSFKDAKTRLQEMLQAELRPLPEYRIASVQGAEHRQTFQVECLLPDTGQQALGSGSSRKRAEQQAAEAMLGLLGS